METGEITIKTITATEGKWLTQNVDSMDNRTFARTIYLGVSDTEANYKEVDDDYKAAYEASEQQRIDNIFSNLDKK